MIPENIETLLKKLKDKTLKGKAFWSKSSGENEFMLMFSNATIIVDIWYNNFYETFSASLKILNKDGDEIENFSYLKNDFQEEYNKIAELHEIVQNKYLKKDDTLNSIFSELNDDDKEIGLPF